MPQRIEYHTNPFTVVVDSSEQHPWSFNGFKCDADRKYKPLVIPTIRKGLKTGDYSIEGLEDLVTIERKSHSDAWGTFSGGERTERFKRQLERMSEMKFSAIVIESDEPRFLLRRPAESRGNKKAIFRSLIAWRVKYGVHVEFCHSRRWAETVCFRLLEKFWRYHHEGIQKCHDEKQRTD